MSEDNIALFDMDESLADLNKVVYSKLKELQSPAERDCYGAVEFTDLWDIRDPWIFKRIELIKSQPSFWSSLPEIPMGIEILNKAKEIGFDCHILTKGPKCYPNAWKEKLEWCQARFGDMPVHITSDKGMVYGKVLYDDYPGYVLRWLKHRPQGLVIMPEYFNNKDFHHKQVVKWNGKNIDQVVDALERSFNRKKSSCILPGLY